MPATMKHYLMLKYWHRKAPRDLKAHYRLPEVGESFDGLARRSFNPIDIFTIEEAYFELRALIKNQCCPTIEVCH